MRGLVRVVCMCVRAYVCAIHDLFSFFFPIGKQNKQTYLLHCFIIFELNFNYNCGILISFQLLLPYPIGCHYLLMLLLSTSGRVNFAVKYEGKLTHE